MSGVATHGGIGSFYVLLLSRVNKGHLGYAMRQCVLSHGSVLGRSMLLLHLWKDR